MCDHFLTVAKGGGHNCKARKNRGRRTDVTCTLEHLDTTASPSQFYPHSHPEYEVTALSYDLSCPICAAVLEWPPQLACGNIICCNCCYRWVTETKSGQICPCCYNHQLDSTTINFIHPHPWSPAYILVHLWLVVRMWQVGASWLVHQTPGQQLHRALPLPLLSEFSIKDDSPTCSVQATIGLQHQQRWQTILSIVSSMRAHSRFKSPLNSLAG